MHTIDVGNVYRVSDNLKYLILCTDGYEVKVRNLRTGDDSTRHVNHIHKAWSLVGKNYKVKTF